MIAKIYQLDLTNDPDINQTGIIACIDNNLNNGDYCLVVDNISNELTITKVKYVVYLKQIGIRDSCITTEGIVYPIHNVKKIIAHNFNNIMEELPRIHKVFYQKYIQAILDNDEIFEVEVKTNKDNQPIIIRENNTIIISKIQEAIEIQQNEEFQSYAFDMEKQNEEENITIDLKINIPTKVIKCLIDEKKMDIIELYSELLKMVDQRPKYTDFE